MSKKASSCREKLSTRTTELRVFQILACRHPAMPRNQAPSGDGRSALPDRRESLNPQSWGLRVIKRIRRIIIG